MRMRIPSATVAALRLASFKSLFALEPLDVSWRNIPSGCRLTNREERVSERVVFRFLRSNTCHICLMRGKMPFFNPSLT